MVCRRSKGGRRKKDEEGGGEGGRGAERERVGTEVKRKVPGQKRK